MNEIRRLIVRLQNLASKARDALALDTIQGTKEALDVVKNAALSAVLEDAKAKVTRQARVRKHLC